MISQINSYGKMSSPIKNLTYSAEKSTNQKSFIKVQQESKFKQKDERLLPYISIHKNDDNDQINKLSLQYLEHNLSRYKRQVISLKSQILTKQKEHKQILAKASKQIQKLKQQKIELQTQIKGQTKLITQYQQKYYNLGEENRKLKNQSQIIQKQIKLLNNKIQDLMLQRRSNDQLSLGFVKQADFYKRQVNIQTQKYIILLQDYDHLRQTNQKIIHQLQIDNKTLKNKIQELEMQLQMHDKQKQIQKLLQYQKQIYTRNHKIQHIQQKFSNINLNNYSKQKNYSKQDNYSKQNNYHKQNNKQPKQSQYINLLKRKIQNLQNKVNTFEKRNKQLQTIVSKVMKSNH